MRSSQTYDPMPYLLLTYDRTTEAIEAAMLLEEAGLTEAVLVPRPRSLVAGCGVALRVPRQDAVRAAEILLRGGRLGNPYLGDPRKGWDPVSPSELIAATDT
ncbi:MAG: DUF3343 domain-containing protein [Armatimonadetes bacterium]|nr:DUF3343 domain-containing protein [Armatimonadota bacterium]